MASMDFYGNRMKDMVLGRPTMPDTPVGSEEIELRWIVEKWCESIFVCYGYGNIILLKH